MTAHDDAHMDVVSRRVQTHYPKRVDRRRAFLLSACATTREHAPSVMAYHVGGRSSREVFKVLNLNHGELSMTSDEVATLMGCSTAACHHAAVRELVESHPCVRELIQRVKGALSVTLQSERARRMWSMPSVRAIVAFSTYLDTSEVMLEKLLGEISRSDLRRLEVVVDDVQANMATSDDHLNALNAIITSFARALDL